MYFEYSRPTGNDPILGRAQSPDCIRGQVWDSFRRVQRPCCTSQAHPRYNTVVICRKHLVSARGKLFYRAPFSINRQNTNAVRWLGLAKYRIVFGGSGVLKVLPRYAIYTILWKFAEKIWSQVESSIFLRMFLPWISKHECSPVIGPGQV